MPVATEAPAPVPPFRAIIDKSWIDYNGHLRDAYYGLICSYAIDELMDHLGLDAAYRAQTSCTLYTLEMHLHFLHEVKGSDALSVHTVVLDADRKRIHAGCLFRCPRVPEPVGAAEVMLLHVRQGATPATAPFPESIGQRLQQLKLGEEAAAGFGPRSRSIEIRRR
jgi:acyl-CoA thioester hydrolase